MHFIFAGFLLSFAFSVCQASTSPVTEKIPRVLSYIESRTLVDHRSGHFGEWRKSAWLGELYARNLVEASVLSQQLSDKLVQARVFTHYLGPERSQELLLKTVGLVEFLAGHHLLDTQGKINGSFEDIEAALAEEFPFGFVARPAVGIAPYESPHGLYKKTDDFILALLQDNSSLYQPDPKHRPIKSHILGAVASGEAVVLQDDFARMGKFKHANGASQVEVYRIHSYEGHALEGSIGTPWVLARQAARNPEVEKRALELVADFLSHLPKKLTMRQAWGVDVGVLNGGELRILGIITNRGERVAWSSYLEEPHVLGAYARYFQSELGYEFDSVGSWLLVHNLSNYFSYWSERVSKTPGWSGKLKSLIPPAP